MADIQMDTASRNITAPRTPIRTEVKVQQNTNTNNAAEAAARPEANAGTVRTQTENRTGAVRQTQDTARLNAGQEITGRSQYGQRTVDQAGNMTDTTREGIALEVRQNVRYENADLGRVIEKQKPWTVQDEERAGQSMAEKMAASSSKRAEETEAQRQAVQESNEERRQQIEETRQQAAENREEQAVNRVRQATSSEGNRAAVAAVEEQAANAPTTYAGISESDLERMVREGEISQNDYNEEMEARKSQQETNNRTGREFNRNMAENINGRENIRRTEVEMRGLEEDNGTLSTGTRAQVLEAVRNNNDDAANRQTQEAISTARASDLSRVTQ